MQRLYEAIDRIEAQKLLDLLQERGVASVVLRDFLSGAAGELPADIRPAVWVVDDDDLVRAKRVLAEFFETAPGEADSAESWICSRCGERSEGQFQACWKCGSARPSNRESGGH